MKIFKKIILIIGGILIIPGMAWAVTAFNSSQVGSTPLNGYYLQTNGSTSSWQPVTASGGYPFQLTGNATSTKTQFNGGLTAFASSTIGNGSQKGGLTVSGGATTTGSSLINGDLLVLGNTELSSLLVDSAATVGSLIFRDSSAQTIQIPTPTTVDTPGGSFELDAGSANGLQSGGNFRINAGNGGTGKTGGDLLLFGGSGNGGADNTKDGKVIIRDPFTGNGASLSAALLTSDGHAVFPAGLSGTTDTLCFQTLANCGSGGGGGSSAYDFPLTGNATSTKTQFNGGLTSYASTTIGAGGITTGLTVNGDSTTTQTTLGTDVTNNYFGRISPTRSLVLSTGTSTTWTASTTGSAYSPYVVAPFAGTIKAARCATDASFLGVNIKIAGSSVTPSYFVSSTTIGKIGFTGSNTFTIGQKISADFGTTSTASALSDSCTIDIIENP